MEIREGGLDMPAGRRAAQRAFRGDAREFAEGQLHFLDLSGCARPA
jgi:hypothetical protein